MIAGVRDEWDIAIVGAGAAGLAAGIFAAQAARGKARIGVLDGARQVGAKILVSGGGRCNVTHDRIDPEADFNGSKHIVRNVLRAFDENATKRWFESMNVPLKREETGKLFPVSDSAKTVLNALLRRCEELGVRVLCGRRVEQVVRAEDGFVVRCSGGEEMAARRVILATGGRSLPTTGSDGHGWEMARGLGHTVTRTYPALVPMVLEESFFHASLSGLSQVVELSTIAEGKRIDRRTGSLLWTHFGVSGPVVMDASRHWVVTKAEGREVEWRANLLPAEGFEQVEKWLVDVGSESPRVSVGNVVGQRVPQRVAEAVVVQCGIETSRPIGQLRREERRTLVHALVGLRLPVVRDRGWNYAEVTAGGVPLGEIDYRTMESRKTRGLSLVGEILDCDGRIGGFNFQWAWATGFVAGTAAGAACVRESA
jgi:predicted Rossmann fold flavoprotein